MMPEEWDERLKQHGIEAVIWAAGEQLDTGNRKITFIFAEKINDRRIAIDEYLLPNEARDCYSAAGVVSKELGDRGIEDVQVALDTEAKTSTIDIRVSGELFQLTKPYC